MVAACGTVVGGDSRKRVVSADVRKTGGEGDLTGAEERTRTSTLLLGLRDRDTGLLLGSTGLGLAKTGQAGETHTWGLGYATEALGAMVNVAQVCE